ncbi:MAG: DUF6285 domain-containing protein [Pseudomonadota bacterium]
MTPAPVLLKAVELFLRETLTRDAEAHEAEDAHRFHTRIAANLLAILRREAGGSEELRNCDETIAEYVGVAPGNRLRAVSLALRDGAQVDERLLDLLKRRTLLQLQIDNPRYSGALQARDRWGPERDAIDTND